MATRLQLRRDTATNWTTTNPILLDGEMAVETDTGKFKVGDGTTAWNTLVYSSGIPGETGPQGEPGEGVPVGGTAGQVLAKIDGVDYNTEWTNAGGGGTAESTSYDNTASGLTATQVQAAIDEVDGDLDAHKAENATLSVLAHVKHATLTAILLSTGWTGATAPYSQSVTVTGIVSTDNPIIDIDLSGAVDYTAETAIITAWGNVYRVATGTDSITAYATSIPTDDIPVQIKVVR